MFNFYIFRFIKVFMTFSFFPTPFGQLTSLKSTNCSQIGLLKFVVLIFLRVNASFHEYIYHTILNEYTL